MASSVNNPTNAKPYKNQPLPFTTEKHVKQLASGPAKDAFNSGKDYTDEGAPLLTSDAGAPQTPKRLGWAVIPGYGNPPTKAEMDGLSRPDETSQTQTAYLREAVVMDIDAKLIISTDAQLKRAVSQNDLSLFREAHYPTLEDYMRSPHYKRLREAKIRLEALVGTSRKLKESNSGVQGIRYNPKLVSLFNSVDVSIHRRLKESGFNKEIERYQKKLREQGGFPSDFGNFGNPGAAGIGGVQANWDGGQSFELGGREPDFIPLISGPYNKQLYWFDYLDMHSKAYEAWTHNPVAKRICKVITQFVLGKGVKVTVMKAERPTSNVQQDPKTKKNVPVMQDFKKDAQEILDRHWTKNTLHIRSKQILRDLIIFGEQFPRYFDAPWGLKIRQIDPSTVWEVVTDPDDCENEFYLHQQYPTRYQWYVDLPIPTIKFIIRQVPSLLYYHMKINSVAGEVRGRSELFAILGWLKRLKEFASDRVIRNKMANLFILDVAVEGDFSAVEAAKAQFATPPTPGSFFIHNKAAELNGVGAEIEAGQMQGDWELLLTVIAMGAGLSQEYLGMATGGGKAQALVGTEPDIKTFEDYQELMENFYLQDAERVFARAKDRNELPRNVGIRVEVTYPSLAEENRSEKLKDMAFMESMSWISHRRSASAAAKEMQFTSYEYDDEQQEIASEDAQLEYLINTAYQQVKKGEDSLANKAAGGGSGSSGGTSSGASGKGASGMGMGKLPGAGGSKQSESEQEPTRESERQAVEGLSATAPGTSSSSHVSGLATTHNASTGDKRDPWGGQDPRDTARSIKREATNLRYERRGVGRRQDRIQSPSKVRDQRSLDRGEIVKKAKKAMRRGNLGHESEEGGPGSGPRTTHYVTKDNSKVKVTEDPDRHNVQIHKDGKLIHNGGRYEAKKILQGAGVEHSFERKDVKLDPEKLAKAKAEFKKEYNDSVKGMKRPSKMDDADESQPVEQPIRRFPRYPDDPPARDQNMGALSSGERDKKLQRQRGATEGGPGSGPHTGRGETDKQKRQRHQDEDSAHIQQKEEGGMHPHQAFEKSGFKQYYPAADEESDVTSFKHKDGRKGWYSQDEGSWGLGKKTGDLDDSSLEKALGLKAKESMEPFKQQDGEKLQRPRIENFPTEKNAHQVKTGKKNNPRGFGDHKRDRI